MHARLSSNQLGKMIRALKHIKTWALKTDGNFSVIASLILSLIVVAAGMTVDLARQERMDSSAQDIADAMVLAAANEIASGANASKAKKKGLGILQG